MSRSPDESLASLRALFQTRSQELQEELFSFLRIPSVSSDPSYDYAMKEAVDWLTARIRSMGFKVSSWPTKGHPVIFASREIDSSFPTVLLYNHYDVQPADDLDKWDTQPFEPEIRDGEIYARGAQDNKGQLFFVLAALELLLERDGTLPCNIKLLIEGEEELGSPGIAKVIPKRTKELKADHVIVADVGIPARSMPTVTVGVRGFCMLKVEVRCHHTALHSGIFGGVTRNPARELSALLASLWDEDQRITVRGFYDDVKEMPSDDKSHFKFDLTREQFASLLGVEAHAGETGYRVLESLWLRPTIEICGIKSGYVGPGFKGIIPDTAHAHISCRLVPDQDPTTVLQQLQRHFENASAPGVDVSVELLEGKGGPWRTSPHAEVVTAAARAIEEVTNRGCEFHLLGASIPIARLLADHCGGDMVLMGYGLPSDNIHAPNEHFGWDRIEQGAISIARTLEILRKPSA